MNTPISFELDKLLLEKDIPMPVNPTISDVVMWLYEKYGIWIYPLPIDDDMKLWQARIIKGEPFNKLSNTLKIISYGEISYKGIYSPTEAYEAAIEYTLKNLI